MRKIKEKTPSGKIVKPAPISHLKLESAKPKKNGKISKLELKTAPDAAVVATNNFKSQSGVDLTEKIKELLRLAQEQGYLTYGDINDALPENVVSPEDLDEIYIKLR